MDSVRLSISLPERVPAQGRRYGRLIWLEVRFSYALLLMPLAVAVAIWFFNNWMWQADRRWDVVSSNIAQTVLLIGPAGAMWAAFVAQREGHSRLGDLTASLPVVALPRHLLVIGTPVAGSVVTYGAGALAMLWWHGREITWGAPSWSLIAFGALVVLACAMVGAAFGQAVRGRFAPVVVSGSIFLYFVMSWTIANPRTSLRGWALLAYPRDRLAMDSPLYEPPPAISADQPPLSAGVVICLAAIATALAVMLAIHARPRVAATLGAIALVGFLVAAQLAIITPADLVRADRAMLAGVDPVENPPLVCREAVVTICLHEIDARDLDQASAAANAMLGPLQGLPGVPSRIEMRADLPSEPDVLRFDMAGYEINATHLVHLAIPALFDPSRDGKPMSAAEQTIAAWLIRDLDLQDPAAFLYPPVQAGEPASDAAIETWRADIDAAADRFAALSLEEQRAWLEANWDALRAGTLNLEDLP